MTRLWIEKSRNCGSILEKARHFSLVQNVQTESGTHSASNSVVSGRSFPLGTAARSSRWRLTSILCRYQEHVDLHPYCILRLRGVRWSDFASTLLFCFFPAAFAMDVSHLMSVCLIELQANRWTDMDFSLVRLRRSQ